MSHRHLNDDRLIDLLVREATEGVDAAEQQEIEKLFAQYPSEDRDEIARVAAALALATRAPEEPLPSALREQLHANAKLWLDARDSTVVPFEKDTAGKRSSSRSSVLPWFAAAACLLLAIGGWWPRLREAPRNQQAQVVQPSQPRVASLAEQRAALLASGAQVTQLTWTNTADPASIGVSGDVVWDNVTQRGFMRFSGLAANDPNLLQYQLWIFDAQQDERYPIDGGVFDIPPGGGDVIVPIKAALGVRAPVMFAVTVEKPGGVVVSGREHIVTLAKSAG